MYLSEAQKLFVAAQVQFGIPELLSAGIAARVTSLDIYNRELEEDELLALALAEELLPLRYLILSQKNMVPLIWRLLPDLRDAISVPDFEFTLNFVRIDIDWHLLYTYTSNTYNKTVSKMFNTRTGQDPDSELLLDLLATDVIHSYVIRVDNLYKSMRLKIRKHLEAQEAANAATNEVAQARRDLSESGVLRDDPDSHTD